MAPAAPGKATSNKDALGVFVSYARRDAAFAARLVEALERRGLKARIDTRDLPTLEEWRRELSGLIAAADAVVFVISPASVASDVCSWEVGQVEAMGKRLAPVVVERVADDRIPAAVAKINYLFFDGDADFEAQADRLAAALQTDLGWLKEHTRIGQLAARWEILHRPARLLLRGEEIKAAERWQLSRPRTAPEVTPVQQAYVGASRAAETRRLRHTVWMSLTAAVAAIGLTLGALWQRSLAIAAREDADANRAKAEHNLDTAIDTVDKFMLTLTADLKTASGLPSGKIKAILDDAATEFDRIAKDAPDNPKLLANRAALDLTYAETFQSIGQTSDALARAGEARDLAIKLAVAYPGNADYARLAQVAANRLALINGRQTAAPASVEAARAAAAKNPNSPDYERDLAVALNVLGDRQRDAGDFDAAEKSYTEAIGIVGGLLDKAPGYALLKTDLGYGYGKLGQLAMKRGAPIRARQNFKAALDLATAASRSEPWNNDLKRNAAIAHDDLGNLLHSVGETQAALDEHEVALRLHEALLLADPNNVTFLSGLANCVSYLAGDHLVLGHTAEARALEEKGLDIMRSIVGIEKTPAPARRRQLEVSLNRVAGYLIDAGDAAAALADRREALDLARGLLRDDATNTLYASDLFLCLANVASVSPSLDEAARLDDELRARWQAMGDAQRGDALVRTVLVAALGRQATLEFLGHDYTGAEAVMREIVAIVPDDLVQQGYLAGTLMFAGKTEAADRIYRRYRGRMVGATSWEAYILDAFAKARQRGISHPHMAAVEAELSALPR